MNAARRLAAIMVADVVGYSRMIGADEEGTLARLKSLRLRLIDPKIDEHRGRMVKTMGDGFLVEFSSVVDALRCADEVQRAMADAHVSEPPDRRLVFRIGIHQGDVIYEEDGDIFGDGVNIAARLESIAEPGGICVSSRVQEDAAGRLGLVFDDMGEQALKNISRPIRTYRVHPTGWLPTADANRPKLQKTDSELLPSQPGSGSATPEPASGRGDRQAAAPEALAGARSATLPANRRATLRPWLIAGAALALPLVLGGGYYAFVAPGPTQLGAASAPSPSQAVERAPVPSIGPASEPQSPPSPPAAVAAPAPTPAESVRAELGLPAPPVRDEPAKTEPRSAADRPASGVQVATAQPQTPPEPSASLGPELPAGPPKPEGEPDLQGRVTGAKRLDEIEVAAQWVKLYGIVDRARGPQEAQRVQALLRYLKPSRNVVVCYRKAADTYRCYADGQDIARLALQDGIAQLAPNAPAEYRSLLAQPR